jgi:SAM-dependent methyltransferase
VGTGYYAFKAVEWVKPGGTIYAIDIQRRMIDHTAHRAHELGISNTELRVADARALPCPDKILRLVYLVTVLGDPHMVVFRKLRKKAERAGFRYECRLGGWLGYFARFEKNTSATAKA